MSVWLMGHRCWGLRLLKVTVVGVVVLAVLPDVLVSLVIMEDALDGRLVGHGLEAFAPL